MMRELNRYLLGWLGYFQLVKYNGVFEKLDGWIRRKLRCVRLKQRKRTFPIAKFLISHGVRERAAWQLALSGKGWWCLSRTTQAHKAMNNTWFTNLGLINLTQKFEKLKTLKETAGYP